MKYQLKTRQICLFFIAFMPIIKIFMLPSVVASFADEDMWLSTLINCALDIITLSSIILVCKSANTTFIGLLESNFGKIGAKIVCALYCLVFILKSILPINEQKDYVEFTLYTLLPTTFYFMPFFIIAFYFCTKKLNLLGRLADFSWVITLIGFFLLFTLSISNADFLSIMPIGARGVGSILKGSYASLPWFGDCVYLLFFIGEFKFKKKDGVKIIFSYLLGCLLVIAFMVIFYSIFTSIAHRQRFALTEISKYTTVISNTGRFDYIGILLILLSNVFALSVPLFFASKLLNYVCSFKKNWISPLIVIGFHLFLALCLSKYFATIEKLIIGYGGIIFFLFSNLLPIFTIILNKRRNKLCL